ncbi:MAG TPA: glycosyltransferase family 4 protein [Candidatus Polarisedimenticolaceae bacterium]|nr:glycosyltransferase family 4 protein [Candidatus Polarisedimenticolaceae bacterium]
MSRRLVFVVSGMRSLPGGIAAVDENLLILLADLVRAGRLQLEIESLLEEPAHRPAELPQGISFRAHRGSKAPLAARLLRHALAGKWLLYERVGLAAATAPLAAAGAARTIVLAHGAETWHEVKPLHALALRAARLVITNSAYTLGRMRACRPLAGRFRGVACPLGLSPAFPLLDAPPADAEGTLPLTAVDGKTRALGSAVLLLVGRMDPGEREKGHDRLIEVLPDVLPHHPEAQLVFAGPGSDRERLEALARARGVAGSVFFPGRVSTETLGDLYRRCFAFVMPSRQEGFGLVYLEAMNYAKPCLGCREDGAEDVIADGDTGILLEDALDRPALARALCGLLDDPRRAAAMGHRGFERLHRHFTAEQFRARFRAILERTVPGL